MGLSYDLISQFVKATKDDTKAKKSEATVNGTVAKIIDGKAYVRIDGSDHLLPETPVSTTSDVSVNDRVIVSIKDHTATVVGNVSEPSGKASEVKKNSSKISDFDTVVAHDVTADEIVAINGFIDNLYAEIGKFDNVSAVLAMIETLKAEHIEAKIIEGKRITADEIAAILLEVETIRSTFIKAVDITTENIDAVNAEFDNLKVYAADFTHLSAVRASIEELDANKISAEEVDAKYATIDFANIDKAAIKQFYALSGIVKNLDLDGATVSGELVGVTIKGDLIEGGTVVADKLVMKGDDGLYYKLNTNGTTVETEQTEYNSLDGSIITAKSIVATKINVSDLVAFGATIGGFKIDDHAIRSNNKPDVVDGEGIYMDDSGQFSLGNSNNYLRYFYDTTDKVYKLAISAASIFLGTSGKNIEDAFDDVNNSLDNIEVGARNLIRNSTTMIYKDYGFYDEEIDNTLYAIYTEETDDVELVSNIMETSYDEGLDDVRLTNIESDADPDGNVTLS